MAEKLTPAQFAARIRKRHPGEYDDLADDDLTARVLQKFPEYADMVNVTPVGQPAPAPENMLDFARGHLATARGGSPAPASAPGSSQNAPQSVAERARARLVSWRTSAAEVKDRAAGGQAAPAPLYSEPTPYEAAASSTTALTAGVGRGLASLLTIPADAAADLFTAGPVRRTLDEAQARLQRLRDGRGDAFRMAPFTDQRIPTPRTALANEAAEDARKTFNKWLGVRENVVNDVSETAHGLLGEVLAPGPEIVTQIRAGMKPKLPSPRAAELVEQGAEAVAREESVAFRVVGPGEEIVTSDFRGAVPANMKAIVAGPDTGISLRDIGDYYVIDDIKVEPSLRRQGIGTGLYEQALRLADEDGKKGLLSKPTARIRHEDGTLNSDRRWARFAADGRVEKVTIDGIEYERLLPSQGGRRAAVAPDGTGDPPPPSAPSALTPTPPPQKPREFGLYTRIREAVDDDWRRVKDLVDDPNTRVSDASNPYDAEKRFHGRVAARLEEGRDIVERIDRDVITTAKAAGVSDRALQSDIDTFLQARHAPERNAALEDGAAGMTDAQAQAELQRIAALPHAKEVERIANELQDLNGRTLDVLREGEVITQDLYDSLRLKYEHHIPLNRIMDDAQDVGPLLAGRPLDVKASGIRAARGSQRAVSDITTNIVANYEQAIIRAEKNRVNLATLRFARDNPELGLFTEARPRAQGFRFDGTTPIIQRSDDQQVLHLFEDGKAVELKIKDPGLALAMRGLGREKVTGVFRAIQAYTRTMSNLATRFNPEFFLPNKIRDLQEAFVFAFSRKELGARGAARTVGRDLASVKDVFDGLRGADTPGARLYQQMRRDGGTTGGLGLSSRQAIEIDIEAIRRTNRSRPRMAARDVVRYVDNLNQIFEDSTRLSVYKTALERGVGRERAAVLAKDASINFNKFGRFGPQVNALYMFANASIQGSVKMARAMKNPKVAGTVTTAVGVAVAATAEWNDSVDPEWRTKVSRYDRTAALVVMLPPSVDGSVNYLKIPVSWGIRPIKIAMDYASDALAGKSDATPGQAVAGTLAAAMESANPVGGTDLTSAAMPTALDLPVDLARNRQWHGGMIGPDPAWDDTMPESERYFRNLPNTLTGAAAVEATEELSERGIEISPADLKYAIDTLGGGSGRFATKVINTMTAIGKGEAPDVNEVPIVNRFVEVVPPERLEAQAAAHLREQARKQEREARRKARQQQLQGQ